LDYVARTYNASILNCHILAIEAVIMDQVTNEVITICTVAVDKPVFEVYKIVVDSEDTAFPLDQAYYDSIAKRYKDAAGSMNRISTLPSR